MRFTSSLFQARARLKGGAIVERGDGEIAISPEYVNVIVPVAPLDAMTNPPTTIATKNTRWASAQRSQVGVDAGGVQRVISISHGLWRFHISFTTQFNGTASIEEQGLRLVAPNGVDNKQLYRFMNVAGQSLIDTCVLDLDLGIEASGASVWFWELYQGASVAGDRSFVSASIIASAILTG